MHFNRLVTFSMLTGLSFAFVADLRADSNETMRAAAGLYRKNCQRCHGTDGTGRSERASLVNVPDFTSDTWQQQRSDAQLRVSLREGKGERMPPFGDVLQDGEFVALIAYVRSFGPPQRPMSAKKSGDFQKRWNALREEWEDLQKQMRDLEASRAASAKRVQHMSSDRRADDGQSKSASPKRGEKRRTEKTLDSKPPDRPARPDDPEPKKTDDTSLSRGP